MESAAGQIYCPFCGQEMLVSEDLEEDYLKSVLTEKPEQGTEIMPPDQENQAEKKTETASSPEEEEDLWETALPKRYTKKQEKTKTKAEKKKPKNKKLRLIILAIIVIAAVCIAIFGYVYHQKTIHSQPYLLSSAKTAYQNHHYEQAAAYLDEFLGEDPENRDALFLRGQVYMSLKEYKKGEKIYNHLLIQDPVNKGVWKELLSYYNEKYGYKKLLERSEKVSDPEILAMFDEYLVPAPTVSKPGGTYEEELELKLSAADEDLTIYYTLDGSKPNKDSEVFEVMDEEDDEDKDDEDDRSSKSRNRKKEEEKNTKISLTEEGETLLRAVCYNKDGKHSRILNESYKIAFKPPKAPSISPDGGTFEKPVNIALTAPEGCKIYYTWRDTEPTTASNRYWGPLYLREGNQVLSAIAVDERGKVSEVAKANFIYYPKR